MDQVFMLTTGGRCSTSKSFSLLPSRKKLVKITNVRSDSSSDDETVDSSVCLRQTLLLHHTHAARHSSLFNSFL